jgi:hypothetical protein
MGCRTWTERSITSKQAPKSKLNAANAVVDSFTADAVAVAHVLRRRNQVKHLVEAARLSVRAAIRTGEELDVERSRQRTGLHEHRGRT